MYRLFLSTLSLRRATNVKMRMICSDMNFYPRSPCGERRYWFGVPLVGRPISIHALLAESDMAFCMDCQKSTYFYPRSPCGERLNAHLYYHSRGLFLSTLSLRRATLRVLDGSKSSIISIHALLAESDVDFLFFVMYH